MQQKPQAKIYIVTLQLDSGSTKEVVIKAGSQEVAEARALKRNPRATGVINVA